MWKMGAYKCALCHNNKKKMGKTPAVNSNESQICIITKKNIERKYSMTDVLRSTDLRTNKEKRVSYLVS